MAISVTKPSVNLREKLNELDQPQGIKGTELLRADTVAEARSLIGAGRKNLIINGGMQVAQRGTSFTVSPNAYTLDRWKGLESSDGSLTIEQSTDAPDDFVNSLKVTVATADTSLGATQYAELQYAIEGLDTAQLNYGSASAKTVTLSFKVKSSLTGTFGGVIANASQNRAYPFTYTISTANMWEDVEITLTGDTTGTWGTSTSTGLYIFLDLGTGSTYSGTAGAWTSGVYFTPAGTVNLIETVSATFYITGVQLEVGSTATDFEHRSYGEELIACKRYFHKQERNAAGGGGDVVGIRIDGISNSRWEQTFPGCPVPMRADPSVSVVTGSVDNTSNNIVSARGAGRYLYMQTDFSGGGAKYFYLTSYTMDAEL